MNALYRQLHNKAIKKWGKTLQMAMLAEECSELSAAALQMIRGRDSFVEREIADVLIMIEQWYVMFPGLDKKVEIAIEEKMWRLEDRLLDK